jgi:hypothetical protein
VEHLRSYSINITLLHYALELEHLGFGDRLAGVRALGVGQRIALAQKSIDDHGSLDFVHDELDLYNSNNDCSLVQ